MISLWFFCTADTSTQTYRSILSWQGLTCSVPDRVSIHALPSARAFSGFEWKTKKNHCATHHPCHPPSKRIDWLMDWFKIRTITCSIHHDVQHFLGGESPFFSDLEPTTARATLGRHYANPTTHREHGVTFLALVKICAKRQHFGTVIYWWMGHQFD